MILTFVAMWLPFCIYPIESETCLSTLAQVLHRLFPFSRGIFEDKVSNFWYVASVVYDFRGRVAQPVLVRMSLGFTLLLLLPTAYSLIKHRISWDRIILSLLASSLAFFLCSFQVHEKSILLSTVPASLYFFRDPIFVFWLQILGSFTIYPLLQKDGQAFPYFIVVILFASVVWRYMMTLVCSEGSGERVVQIDSKQNGIFVLLL